MNTAVNELTGQFRPMQSADLNAIMAIEVRAYPHPWTHGIFRDCIRVGYSCWVYEREAEIRAYGVMSVAVGEAHMLNLTVAPEYQRKGLGRRLLAYFLNLALRYNADTVLLEVRPSNIPAIGLYENMGFNEIGIRKNYYPLPNGREDALVLAKSLTLAE